MKTIMVSGVSGIVGYGILKSIRQYDDSIRLIGTSIYDNTVARSFCDVFEKVPRTLEENYYDHLKCLVKKYKIDLLIPSIEIDVYSWNSHRQEIESMECKVLLNSESLIDACQDKWMFYQLLASQCPQYAIPTTLQYDGSTAYPLLLKPRRGYASQGIVRVATSEELKEYTDDIGSHLMIQPMIGDAEHEYTVSAFFDKASTLCAYNALRRSLSKQGFTETAETTEVDGIVSALTDIAAVFKPVGPTNFQFRIDKDGSLKLLEVNPRISSATSIRTAFGYNESAMSIRYFLKGEEITEPRQRKGKAIRYVEDMIYYEDSLHL